MKINTVKLEVAEQVKATRAYLEERSPPDCIIDGWLEASRDFRFEIIRGDELVHQVVFSYKFLYFHTVEGIRSELEDRDIAKRLREAGKEEVRINREAP
jgi:hypothetical protein